MHRVIGRVREIRDECGPAKRGTAKLRIGHNEVLRKAGSADQAANFIRKQIRPVEKVRKAANVFIRQEISSRTPLAHCHGPRNRCSIDESNTRNGKSLKHRVEQWSVASRLCDVKRLQ